MAPAAPATELAPLPPAGRRFRGAAAVHLGDTDPRGLLRLDALARHLQDVANDDALDSGIDNSFGWVVRRTLVAVEAPAVLGERLALTTFCSGTGRSWAERRTSITGDRAAAIEAVSLWVQLDAGTGRPAPLDRRFHDVYGDAAAGRRVSARLSLPSPPEDALVRPWLVRRADLDVFDHVNNAVLWAILEEAIGPVEDPVNRRGVAEIEYLAPVDAGTSVDLRVSPAPVLAAWLVGAGTVHCAARWRPASVPPRV